MSTKDTQGIFVKSNRTFYLLETGDISPGFPLQRIKSLLIQRELITYHRESATDREPDHKTMTLGEAEEKGVDIERIFLSKHIEKLYHQKQEQEEKDNPWNK